MKVPTLSGVQRSSGPCHIERLGTSVSVRKLGKYKEVKDNYSNKRKINPGFSLFA